MLEAVGIKPSEAKVIIVKLGYLEPEIRAIAKRSVMVPQMNYLKDYLL